MDSIPKDIRADVNRVEQKRAYYCGPACCQMFLGHYNIACDQADAFAKIAAANKESEFYFSDPHGVANFINSVKGASIPHTIEPFTTKSFQDLIDRIFYTLDYLKLPCIALSLAGAHWIVIDGLRSVVNPDGGSQSLGVYVENPWYNEAPDYYSSIEDLSSTVILANKYGHEWKDLFVILSDDSKPKLKALVPMAMPIFAKAGGGVSANPHDAALLSVGLHGFDLVQPIASGGGAPVLTTIEVTGLDGWGDYYLVPLDATNTPEFKDFIYVAIDKMSGNLLQIATLSSAMQIYSDSELQRDVGVQYAGAKIDVLPGYFWKPCYELRSRFNVVRRFTLNSNPQLILPTGKIVGTLTDFKHGA